MANPEVTLKPGREHTLRRGHPWVFATSIAREPQGLAPGASVDVLDATGAWLARGAWSPASQIRVRAWTWQRDEAIDAAFFRRRLTAALSLRETLGLGGHEGACRVLNAEGDGLPGVVLDRYGPHLVAQFLSAGAEAFREEIARAALEATACRGVYERSDVEVRAKEGLPQRAGALLGDEPPPEITIREGELRLMVDVRNGHKTGLYLDQRDNRAAVAPFVRGARVLNVFCYTGGFGLAAGVAGASQVTQLDQSAPALELARRNAELNGTAARTEHVQADAFAKLREWRDEGRRFDLIVLDPPKFVASAAQLDSARRGYKDINLLGFKLLAPGGVLCTFSCSGHMQPEMFRETVAEAAADARVQAQVLRQLGQAPDHPYGLHYPEGFYLKGLMLLRLE